MSAITMPQFHAKLVTRSIVITILISRIYSSKKEPSAMAYFKFGVDSFIWTEAFGKKDIWIIPKARELGFEVVDLAIAHPEAFPLDDVLAAKAHTGLELVTTTTLDTDTSLISPDAGIRKNGVRHMKLMVDINRAIGSKILGGVIYAGWGCLTKRPRTEQEWEWSVASMKEISGYAKDTWDGAIAVECVNRFETHFLNIAEDAIRYCKDVGNANMKVHLDCFHMIREEKSFSGAVKACGKQYLGYVHVNENDRGIPGTGLVPFPEFMRALLDVGYDGPVTIESFDPSFEELSGSCAIWRKFADSGEDLAIQGLANLKRVAASL
ncbi:MAG: sugar phosphate isomerase/epimerase [Clostridiales bacterium]|nr:sugar phosphate isomerase/epimerase [Clostridiales bacterium]